MFADVVFDHLADEAVHGAATGRSLLQNPRALAVAVHQPLDGVDLTSQSFQSVEQLGFLFGDMRHVWRSSCFILYSPIVYSTLGRKPRLALNALEGRSNTEIATADIQARATGLEIGGMQRHFL